MGVTMARDTLLSRPMESTRDFKQQMLDLWRSVSMPLDKMKVTSEYGMRFHPIYHRSMAHNGLDFSAPTGTKVYAMLDGVIKRIGYDKRTDIAVLHVNSNYPLPRIVINENRETHLGDVVLAIGNPYNLGQTITSGIISAVGRRGSGITRLNRIDITDGIQDLIHYTHISFTPLIHSGIDSLSENACSDPYMRRAFFDRNFKIAGHSH